jgi:DNA polymerase III subunit delta
MAAMAPPSKNFTFVCGQDDYLVSRLGRERYQAATAEVTDEFAREVISGFAANVDEVETAVNRFREAVQTVPMFGGRRVIWLKDVNFLADTVTGRAEGTMKAVEDLQQILAAVQPEETGVIITAAPVDRRRSFLKWCEKNADFALAGGGGGDDALAGVALGEARELGTSFGPGAVDLLLAKVGANTRLLVEEVRKLATYAEGRAIAEADVAELTANTAEGEFFESADAFFSGDLGWTIGALHRHFFTGGDARPIIAALQSRNRLLLQVRTLVDAGEVRLGPNGLSGLAEAAAVHRDRYGTAAAEKSSYNIFSQNAWYVGKVVGAAKLPSLRRLIDNQREFITAFEEILRRPHEQEDVLRDLSVRCLG